MSETIKDKHIIILEGPDCSGKTSLLNHLSELANHHCHTIHSNYDKSLPQENHFRQHKLITKFVCNNFKQKNYTGNNFVILDRNYISDIVYGSIGYGSRGAVKQKLSKLVTMLSAMKTCCSDINVSVVYCKPSKDVFNDSEKEELLSVFQHNKIKRAYDKFFDSTSSVRSLFDQLGVNFYTYDFCVDPYYVELNKNLFNNNNTKYHISSHKSTKHIKIKE